MKITFIFCFAIIASATCCLFFDDEEDSMMKYLKRVHNANGVLVAPRRSNMRKFYHRLLAMDSSLQSYIINSYGTPKQRYIVNLLYSWKENKNDRKTYGRLKSMENIIMQYLRLVWKSKGDLETPWNILRPRRGSIMDNFKNHLKSMPRNLRSRIINTYGESFQREYIDFYVNGDKYSDYKVYQTLRRYLEDPEPTTQWIQPTIAPTTVATTKRIATTTRPTTTSTTAATTKRVETTTTPTTTTRRVETTTQGTTQKPKTTKLILQETTKMPTTTSRKPFIPENSNNNFIPSITIL